MKLHVEHKKVKITEKDLGIKDEKFSFNVKVLTYKENMSLMDDSKKEDGELDSLEFAEKIFVNSIMEWENITNMNDEILECNEANKRAVFNFNPEFCQKVIESATKKLSDDKKK